MDEKQPEITKLKSDKDDSANLPAIMASLEMLSVNTSLSKPPGSKRILRKRMSQPVSPEILNRRCSTKPKKRTSSEMESHEEVKDYYLDKKLKRKPNNLETIFEEKDGLSDNSIYMSVKRYRRMIQFEQYPTDSKIKKRRAKAKKVFGSKINYRRKRSSMETLLDKLNRIRGDSPSKIENEVK